MNTVRQEVRDCLLSKKFSSLADLPINARVGTCSPRRKAILLKSRPDLQIIQLRGNIDSRIRKVIEGEIDAIILALCGLKRSGLTDLVKEIFDIVTNHLKLEKIDVPITPALDDDVAIVVLDPTKTNAAFKWGAKVSFVEMIKRQLQWYDQHGISDVFTHLKPVA